MTSTTDQLKKVSLHRSQPCFNSNAAAAAAAVCAADCGSVEALHRPGGQVHYRMAHAVPRCVRWGGGYGTRGVGPLVAGMALQLAAACCGKQAQVVTSVGVSIVHGITAVSILHGCVCHSGVHGTTERRRCATARSCVSAAAATGGWWRWQGVRAVSTAAPAPAPAPAQLERERERDAGEGVAAAAVHAGVSGSPGIMPAGGGRQVPQQQQAAGLCCLQVCLQCRCTTCSVSRHPAAAASTVAAAAAGVCICRLP